MHPLQIYHITTVIIRPDQIVKLYQHVIAIINISMFSKIFFFPQTLAIVITVNYFTILFVKQALLGPSFSFNLHD